MQKRCGGEDGNGNLAGSRINNKMMNSVKIAESFVGVPYMLGGEDVDSGVDCFSYIMLYMESNGVKIPKSWGGFDRDKCGSQYGKLFIDNPDYAKKLMVKFIAEFLDEVPVKDSLPGDVLLLEPRGAKSRSFLGIMSGMGNF